jgi:hypothetical protein
LLAGECCYHAPGTESYGDARAQASHARLLHAVLRDDDRRRLAGGDGRLAEPRRAARRRAGFRIGRVGARADRLRLRAAGDGDAGRGERDRLHRQGVSRNGQLPNRLDDGARLRDRVPVGSGGDWKNRRVHLSVARPDAALPHRWRHRLLPSSGDRARPRGRAHMAQLSRHPLERHVSKLDDVPLTRAFCPVRFVRRGARSSGEPASAFQPQRLGFRSCRIS